MVKIKRTPPREFTREDVLCMTSHELRALSYRDMQGAYSALGWNRICPSHDHLVLEAWAWHKSIEDAEDEEHWLREEMRFDFY